MLRSFAKLSAVATVLCTLAVVPVFAQAPAAGFVSAPAKAEVSLAGASVTIDYCAPQAHGRVIFGGLVPYDEVWRTGANAATTFKTSVNLKIGDLAVPAGTYTVYSVPSKTGWQLVINKQTGQWGTVYDKSQDFGRVPMTVGTNPSPLEKFVIDFEKTSGPSTELHLKWAGVDASVKVMAAK